MWVVSLFNHTVANNIDAQLTMIYLIILRQYLMIWTCVASCGFNLYKSRISQLQPITLAFFYKPPSNRIFTLTRHVQDNLTHYHAGHAYQQQSLTQMRISNFFACFKWHELIARYLVSSDVYIIKISSWCSLPWYSDLTGVINYNSNTWKIHDLHS